jgi:hypothetical protein
MHGKCERYLENTPSENTRHTGQCGFLCPAIRASAKYFVIITTLALYYENPNVGNNRA